MAANISTSCRLASSDFRPPWRSIRRSDSCWRDSFWTPGPARVLVFAAALTLTEWLRGNLFTGFPWNAFGMALGGNLVAAQLASIIGLYGLTLVAILIFSAPATLVGQAACRRGRSRPAARPRSRSPPFSPSAPSGWRGPKDAFVPGVALKIMQPNLAQDDKFRPAYKDAILTDYLKLSDLATDADSTGVTVVIWPESAFPFILSRDAEAMAEIAAALPPGSFVVTGAARAEEDPASPAGGLGPPSSEIAHPIFFNAIQVIANSGVILDTYDKAHLVPFGEYLPFESILSRAWPASFRPYSRRLRSWIQAPDADCAGIAAGCAADLL